MKRIRTILPFLLVAAATGGFLACAFASSDIWLDEAATLALASRHSFQEIPGITAGDVHPPLYYWLLRIPLLLFPGSTAAAKAFSVLPCTLVLLHGVLFLVQSKRSDAAFLFAFAFCASARIAEIATDVRMYSWASLFVFETGLGCWRVLQERRTRDFAALGVLASLAAWTHYAAGLAAALAIAGTVVAAFLLYPRKRLVGQFALTGLAGTLLYSPWLVVLVRQVGCVNDGQFWVKTVPGLRTVRSCIFGLFEIGPETASTAMLGAALIVFVRIAFGFFPRSSSQTEQSTRAGIAVLAAAPLATAACLLLYSRFVSPVFTLRYVSPGVPLLLLAVAIAFSQELPSFLNKIAVAVLALCAVLAMYRSFRTEIRWGRNWTTFAATLGSKTGPETQFVHLEPGANHSRGILTWLLPSHPHFSDAKPSHVEFYLPDADWRSLEDVDWTKPWCVVASGEPEPAAEALPVALLDHPFDLVRPSRTYSKGWRLFWGSNSPGSNRTNANPDTEIPTR